MSLVHKFSLSFLNSIAKRVLLKALIYWKATCITKSTVRVVKKLQNLGRSQGNKSIDNPILKVLRSYNDASNDKKEEEFLIPVLYKTSNQNAKSHKPIRKSTSFFDEIKASLQTKAQNTGMNKTPDRLPPRPTRHTDPKETSDRQKTPIRVFSNKNITDLESLAVVSTKFT
ncbi:hypothetical protein SteCoe_11340 [Stentor coeruleus]|uniref:Uncharacterized protein n=1 Tax=Stentor coeruleus TaxID=5963 RepID=A0A1R2CDD5_9CILI|nr:hypothetical protein SteCoe_11340 [Stentor coeruleus]